MRRCSVCSVCCWPFPSQPTSQTINRSDKSAIAIIPPRQSSITTARDPRPPPGSLAFQSSYCLPNGLLLAVLVRRGLERSTISKCISASSVCWTLAWYLKNPNGELFCRKFWKIAEEKNAHTHTHSWGKCKFLQLLALGIDFELVCFICYCSCCCYCYFWNCFWRRRRRRRYRRMSSIFFGVKFFCWHKSFLFTFVCLNLPCK